MRKSFLMSLPLFFIFCGQAPASAQEFPKVELFGGLSYARSGGINNTGWTVSGSKNLGPVLGIAVDFSRLHGSHDYSEAYHLDQDVYTIMAGPRATSRDPGKLAPYIQLLLGAAHTRTDETVDIGGPTPTQFTDSANGFAMSLGGGIDVRAKGPLAFRVFQMEYFGYRTYGYWTKGFRLSVGLALRFGASQ